MHIHLLHLLIWIIGLTTAPFLAAAQTVKETTEMGQVWLGYLNQTRISNRLGIWFDAQLSTKHHLVNELFQSEIRPALMYYINDNTKLAAGYTHLNNFPGDNHKNISQPEHRVWQHVQWHTKYSTGINTMQWFRLEERYVKRVLNDSTLSPAYNFSYRMRYNFLMNVPLRIHHKPSPFSYVINNEVFVNFGKNIVNNYFDQNRFFTGFSYKLNSHDNLQFGYMNLFQETAAGNKYKMIHAARIFYFNNIDLRKKKVATTH